MIYKTWDYGQKYKYCSKGTSYGWTTLNEWIFGSNQTTVVLSKELALSTFLDVKVVRKKSCFKVESMFSSHVRKGQTTAQRSRNKLSMKYNKVSGDKSWLFYATSRSQISSFLHSNLMTFNCLRKVYQNYFRRWRDSNAPDLKTCACQSLLNLHAHI